MAAMATEAQTPMAIPSSREEIEECGAGERR